MTVRTAEHNAKIAAALLGKPKSREAVEKQRATVLARRDPATLSGNALRARARRKFLEQWPLAPWLCIFCDGKIWKKSGWDTDSLNVHHADGDLLNMLLSNLKPCHHGCHQSHHAEGNQNWRSR